MDSHTRNLLLVVVLLCPSSFAIGQQREGSKNPDLPNFYQVNSQLYRGGQPGRNGLEGLKKLGIKTVINLRDNDDNAKTEESEAEALGLSYFNVPLNNFKQPSDQTVEGVLKLINSAENQPVFVHCKRGSDRTGTIVALYRIDTDGWTNEEAKDEAKQFGMGFWQIEMRKYIDNYYRRKQSSTKR